MHATPRSGYRRAMERLDPRPRPTISAVLESWDKPGFGMSMATYVMMEPVDKIAAGICTGNIAMTAQSARDKYIHHGSEELILAIMSGALSHGC
jgi:hypothetical protein